jgi:hypothetical protein
MVRSRLLLSAAVPLLLCVAACSSSGGGSAATGSQTAGVAPDQYTATEITEGQIRAAIAKVDESATP